MIIFWVSVLALSILLYVLLDGFDLGVGILFGFTREETRRRVMMSSIAPVWDGNETWLVVAGVVLWGAFPPVYATLLSAFYLPVALMLAGLILRGVAFEFRNKGEHSRWIWDTSFFAGSLVAAFMQGLMVGALVRGLPLAHGEYVGGPFGWLSPFALLCGAGFCLGYTLLGACWLIGKGDAGLRAAAFGLIRWLSGALAALLVVVFVYSLAIHLSVMSRWLTRPYLFTFPVVGLALLLGGDALRGGVWNLRGHLLAVHDSFFDHRRAGRGPTLDTGLHVLGGRPFCVSPHALLYRHCLPCVPRPRAIKPRRLLTRGHREGCKHGRSGCALSS
jgi:cytochrome d ubiquinol oxidase subunit II